MRRKQTGIRIRNNMNQTPDIKQVRIDKFLWAARIYKTRSVASEACRKGRIIINNIQVKPSRSVTSGEVITVRKPPVIYTYRVIEPIENRVSSKLAPKYIEDLTSEEERAKTNVRLSGITGYRERGSGRPTKKERRNLDRFTDDSNNF
jgi:ribosome-associated heat shock protein Hsp15